MIESITLKNFQKWKYLKLDFKKINVLVGDNGAGKSAVIRALRFVCLNHNARKTTQSVVDPFIRHGAKFCKVILVVDGHTIIRAKGSCGNYYKLDGKKFSAVGRNQAPDEIVNLLKLDEINFQSQLDRPYWFTESSGQISKNLNEIVNLDCMDQALSRVAQKLKEAKLEYDVSDRRLKEHQEQLKSFSWVKSFKIKVERLQKLKTRADSLAEKRSLIELLASKAQSHSATVKNLTQAISEGEKLNQIGSQYHKTSKARRALKNLIADAEKQQGLIENVPDISSLAALRKSADMAAEERRGLQMLIEDYAETAHVLKQIEADLAEEEKSLKEIKVCPTCQRPWQ